MLESSKKYSTKSLYKLMTSGGVVELSLMKLWEFCISLKSEDLYLDGDT